MQADSNRVLTRDWANLVGRVCRLPVLSYRPEFFKTMRDRLKGDFEFIEADGHTHVVMKVPLAQVYDPPSKGALLQLWFPVTYQIRMTVRIKDKDVTDWFTREFTDTIPANWFEENMTISPSCWGLNDRKVRAQVPVVDAQPRSAARFAGSSSCVAQNQHVQSLTDDQWPCVPEWYGSACKA